MKQERLSILSPLEEKHTLETATELYLSILKRFAAIPDSSFTRLGDIQSRDVTALPLPYLRVKSAGAPRKKVIITAGIHGDEPAGVLAVLRFLEEFRAEFRSIELSVFPCLNPVGFVRRHRLGSTHHDLNRVVDLNSIAPEMRLFLSAVLARGESFDAVLDLHEDNPDVICDFAPNEPTPADFYLYESARESRQSLGAEVVSAVRSGGFPVSPWKTIYGDRAENGVVTGSTRKRGIYDLERFAINALAPSVITSETPMHLPLRDRVEAQIAVIKGALRALAAR